MGPGRFGNVVALRVTADAALDGSQQKFRLLQGCDVQAALYLAGQAQQLAQEGLKISHGQPSIVDVVLELGYQSLERGDLSAAASYWRDGILYLIHTRNSSSWELFLDGLTLRAARQGKTEVAARLSGSRWYRGNIHTLAPSERATRTAILEEIKNLLGEERYAQLSQAGQALTFIQMLAIVQELLELNP